jgi:hypothetical protein
LRDFANRICHDETWMKPTPNWPINWPSCFFATQKACLRTAVQGFGNHYLSFHCLMPIPLSVG